MMTRDKDRVTRQRPRRCAVSSSLQLLGPVSETTP